MMKLQKPELAHEIAAYNALSDNEKRNREILNDLGGYDWSSHDYFDMKKAEEELSAPRYDDLDFTDWFAWYVKLEWM